MGLNFFATVKAPKSTDSAHGEGVGAETIHLGRSSAGNVFTVAIQEEYCLMTWADWKVFLAQENVTITNGFGGTLTLKQMTARVEGPTKGPYGAGLRRDPDARQSETGGLWQYHEGDFR